MMHISTFEATPNIAVVKYWGKRDEKLVLPTNSSISMTLAAPTTVTSVMFSPHFEDYEFWLNGKKQNVNDKELRERLVVLDDIRGMAGMHYGAKIVSVNNFPTAAGFASSASGLAALVCAASKAAMLDLSAKELSMLARLGSGSACRSVYGGFVEWQKGKKKDGSDSFAEQIAPPTHWPEIRLVSAVVDAGKKSISSRAGMKQTVETAPTFKKRLKWVETAFEKMRNAIIKKDFQTFADITMKESDSMHGVMADTKPTIVYLNETSREVMEKVRQLNSRHSKFVAAYTFDAGPNPHIYTTAPHVAKVKGMLLDMKKVKEVFVTTAGNGPRELKEHLLDENGDLV